MYTRVLTGHLQRRGDYTSAQASVRAAPARQHHTLATRQAEVPNRTCSFARFPRLRGQMGRSRRPGLICRCQQYPEGRGTRAPASDSAMASPRRPTVREPLTESGQIVL